MNTLLNWHLASAHQRELRRLGGPVACRRRRSVSRLSHRFRAPDR